MSANRSSMPVALAGLWAAGIAGYAGLAAFGTGRDTWIAWLLLGIAAVILIAIVARLFGAGDASGGFVDRIVGLVLLAICAALVGKGTVLFGQYMKSGVGMGTPDFIVPLLMMAAGIALAAFVIARWTRRARDAR